MARDLTDRVIIITGASSGIGAATAIHCARAGMNLLLTARRADRLGEVGEQVRALGREVELLAGDVRDAGISERALDAAEARFGRFDAVFSNAGYGFEKPVHEMTEAELREIFDVNFFASFDLIRAAARRLMNTRRPGHLIMCSSCLAKFTLPYYSAYSATKAAQNHLCRAMNLELAPHGIHVSSVHPITTRTEFFEVSRRASGRPVEPGTGVPDHAPRLFVQTADRVARAVVRCLRAPKPEVWTSFLVRVTAGMMTASPRFYDFFMRAQAKAERRARENEAAPERG